MIVYCSGIADRVRKERTSESSGAREERKKIEMSIVASGVLARVEIQIEENEIAV